MLAVFSVCYLVFLALKLQNASCDGSSVDIYQRQFLGEESLSKHGVSSKSCLLFRLKNHPRVAHIHLYAPLVHVTIKSSSDFQWVRWENNRVHAGFGRLVGINKKQYFYTVLKFTKATVYSRGRSHWEFEKDPDCTVYDEHGSTVNHTTVSSYTAPTTSVAPTTSAVPAASTTPTTSVAPTTSAVPAASTSPTTSVTPTTSVAPTTTAALTTRSSVTKCPVDKQDINSTDLLVNMTGHTVNSTLLYFCNKYPGGVLSGDRERRCLQNGSWSGKEPKCEVRCADHNYLINSTGLLVNISGNTVNSTLTYTCNGTATGGDMIRRCLENGSWSDKEPVCEIQCPIDDNIINSTGLLTNVTGSTVNGTLTYTCDKTVTAGNTVRRCLENGSWSGTEPTCVNSTRITDEEFKQMIEDMKIDVRNTSKNRRKLFSASDKRLSSKVIGVTGIAVLATVGTIIVTPDGLRFLSFLWHTLRYKRKRRNFIG